MNTAILIGSDLLRFTVMARTCTYSIALFRTRNTNLSHHNFPLIGLLKENKTPKGGIRCVSPRWAAGENQSPAKLEHYFPLTAVYRTLRYSTVLYGTLWYSTVLYGTLWYSTVLYSTLRYSMVLYGTLRYSMVLYSTLRCSMVLYGALWYSNVLFRIVTLSPSHSAP
jgi:hypothetical protein